MKLLLDQDVYAATVRFLSSLGHDVLPVTQIGLSRADDSDPESDGKPMADNSVQFRHITTIEGNLEIL